MADKPIQQSVVEKPTTEQQTVLEQTETTQENNQKNQDTTNHQSSTSSSLSTSSLNTIQTYTSFEDLQPSQDPFDLNKIISSLTNISEWRQQFQGLESLRILNKFDDSCKFIEVIFPECLMMVLELVDSIRSNLSKNALLLISEILLKHRTDAMPEKVASQIIKKLFEKLINDKQFVRIEVEIALDRLHNSQGCCNLTVISTLLELVFNKNFKISENAGNSLWKIIQKHFEDAEGKDKGDGQIEEQLENDKFHENNLDWKEDKQIQGIIVSQKTSDKSKHLDQQILSVLMPSIVKCLNGKRAVLKRVSSQIANLLYQVQGINIIDSLSVEEQKVLMAIIKQNSSNSNTATSKPSFREFLAAKKQQHSQEDELI